MRTQSELKGFLGPLYELKSATFVGTNWRLTTHDGENAHQSKLVLGAIKTDRRLLRSAKAWDLVLVVDQPFDGGGVKGLVIDTTFGRVNLAKLKEDVFLIMHKIKPLMRGKLLLSITPLKM